MIKQKTADKLQEYFRVLILLPQVFVVALPVYNQSVLLVNVR